MKILDFIFAFGICLVFSLNFLPDEIQSYLVSIPALLLISLIVFFLRREKFEKSLLVICYLIVLCFFIKGFEYGISLKSIVSLLGILLIPLITMIYIPRNTNSILKSFVYLFSLCELIIFYFSFKYNVFFDFVKTIQLREISWIYPNYFAMLSVIKIGISCELFNRAIITKKKRDILSVLSILVIFVSMSRTAVIILILFVCINFIFLNEKQTNKKVFFKKLAMLLIIAILVYFSYDIFAAKDSHDGSTVERTMDQRYERWDLLFEFFKNNYLLGVGFRSTTEFLDIGSAHNDYLDLLFKGGLIMFIVLYGFYFKRVYMLIKGKKYTLFSIMISIFAASLTQNPLKFFPIMSIFSLILAESYKVKVEKNIDQKSSP